MGSRGARRTRGKRGGQSKEKRAAAKIAEAKAKRKAKQELQEEVAEEDVFWRPTWDTLGPLEKVKTKGKTERNKMGRKREKADPVLGMDVILNKAPLLRSKKAIEAEKAEAASKAQPQGPSRRARLQKRRRQRKLALMFEGGTGERLLPLPAPEPSIGVAEEGTNKRIKHVAKKRKLSTAEP